MNTTGALMNKKPTLWLLTAPLDYPGISLVAPTVAIFGPTSPERWKPAGKLLGVARAKDMKPESVTVKDILKFI